MRHIGILLLFLLLACSGASAEVRLQEQFGLPRATPMQDTAAVRRAVLAVFPRGTAESTVRQALAARHVGSDGASSYHPPDSTGEAVVRIEATRRSWNLVQPHYAVIFQYDSAQRLQDVAVRRWLTGP